MVLIKKKGGVPRGGGLDTELVPKGPTRPSHELFEKTQINEMHKKGDRDE